MEIVTREALQRLPKADLHCHALLSAPRQVYAMLSRQPIPPFQGQGFEAFTAYVKRYYKPFFRQQDAFRLLIRAAFQAMLADGVTCATPSFDLSRADLPDFTLDDFIRIIAEEVGRVADQIRIYPELSLKRRYGAAINLARLRQVIPARLFYAIDLAGDECDASCREFQPVFQYAKAQGLFLKAHVGELRGAAEIADAIHLLHVEAIQHGLRAVDAPDILELLVEKQIYCNLCLTSNYRLGLVTRGAHPLLALLHAGVPVTINTDDYTVFESSVSQELYTLHQEYACPASTILKIIANGLQECQLISQRTIKTSPKNE